MKYCINCKRMVEPIKKLNWLGLIFFGLLYVPYYLIKQGRCPMCNSTNWGLKK